MGKSFLFSRRGVSLVTLVTLLATQFGPMGLNIAFAATGEGTATISIDGAPATSNVTTS